MKVGIVLLFFLVSCASRKPARHPAFHEIYRFGEISQHHSLVQIFPSEKNDESLSYYLYVQLKDENGNFVDVGAEEFSLRTSKGERVGFAFERVLSGRYYLMIDKAEHVMAKKINLYVQGKCLKDKIMIQLQRPHASHTRIKMVANEKNNLTFELKLADKHNRPVVLPETPEILLDGQGEIYDIKQVKEGVWHFKVIIPDDNQIMYLGMRALGVLMQDLYRYQHIEKYYP